MSRLTVRQEKFCFEYAKLGNATMAYKAAGYSVSNDDVARVNASKLLSNANIKERLNELQNELKSKKIMDIREMKESLTRIARQEATEETITLKGNKRKHRNSVREAVKAIELLGKMSGAFINRQELEISGAMPVVLMDDVRE